MIPSQPKLSPGEGEDRPDGNFDSTGKNTDTELLILNDLARE